MSKRILSFLLKNIELKSDYVKVEIIKLIEINGFIVNDNAEFNMITYILQKVQLWDILETIFNKYKNFIQPGNLLQLIIMFCERKKINEAIELLNIIKNTKHDHFRFYFPILSELCQTSNELSYDFFTLIKQNNKIEISKEGYIEMLKSQKDLLIIDKILIEVQEKNIELNISLFGNLTRITNSGYCKNCNNTLLQVDISIKDKIDIINKLQCEKINNEYEYNIVLDGANIGFYDNKGNTKQIDPEKINKILSLLPKEYKPLIVLNSRHKRSSINIKHKNIIFTPIGINDDYYWLNLTMIKDCFILTNDKMKDHAYETLKQKEFKKWKLCHNVTYDFNRLYFPEKFSKCVQKVKQYWHIPVYNNWYCYNIEQ